MVLSAELRDASGWVSAFLTFCHATPAPTRFQSIYMLVMTRDLYSGFRAELGLLCRLTNYCVLPYSFLVVTFPIRAGTKDGVRDLHRAGRQTRGKPLANAAGTAGRLCLARIERAEN